MLTMLCINCMPAWIFGCFSVLFFRYDNQTRHIRVEKNHDNMFFLADTKFFHSLPVSITVTLIGLSGPSYFNWCDTNGYPYMAFGCGLIGLWRNLKVCTLAEWMKLLNNLQLGPISVLLEIIFFYPSMDCLDISQ